MGVLEWAYERHRSHAIPLVALVLFLIAEIGLVTPSILLVDQYLGLTGAESLRAWVATNALLLLTLVGLLVLARSPLRPAIDWVNGDESNPDAAWTATKGASVTLIKLAVPFIVPFLGIVVLTLGLPADPGWKGWLALGFGAVGALTLGGMLFRIGLDLVARPLLEDTASRMTSAPASVDGWSVRGRIVAGSIGLAWATGLFTGAFTWAADNGPEAYLLSQLGAVAMALFWGLLFRWVIVAPVLRPMGDLVAGTERVRAGDYSKPLPLTSTDDLGGLVLSFNAMQSGLQERASLYAAFGTYVDPDLTERVLAQGDAAMLGEEVEVTVAFVDVRDFTQFAADVGAVDAVNLLNDLFSVVVPIVRDERGHANHFLGDGVLAVFGAPVPLDDHADRALVAAERIQADVAARFGGALRIGIGLNTGRVIAGTVGGGGKLEYTVIGDAVNVASRVEELTKVIGDDILLTEATAAALCGTPALVARGSHQLRGRREPIGLYAVASR